MRLSLTNLNTAQLELSQSNLQREKEAALSELQESLNDKRAQEIAMLQTRQQFELERIKEQRRAETEQLTHKHLQEMGPDELPLKLSIHSVVCLFLKTLIYVEMTTAHLFFQMK